ncbi:MAG: hypothetical protein ACRDBR_00430 [Metamycoplasmataceae bacterium]
MTKNKKIQKMSLFLLSGLSIIPIVFLSIDKNVIQKEITSIENKKSNDVYKVGENKNNNVRVSIPHNGGNYLFNLLKEFKIKTPGWSNWAFGDEEANYPYNRIPKNQHIDFNYNKNLSDFIFGNIDLYEYINKVIIDLNIENLKIEKRYFGGRNHNTDKTGTNFDEFSYSSFSDLIPINNSFNKNVLGFQDIEVNQKHWDDYLKLTSRLEIENNFSQKILKVTLKYHDEIKDSSKWDSKNGVYYWDVVHKIINNGNIKLDLILPYTTEDVEQIKDNINTIVAKPLKIFSDDLKVYSSNNLNKIQVELGKRIDDFYSNNFIKKSKVGFINNTTTKFTYLNPPPSQVDNLSKADHNITFSLMNKTDVFKGAINKAGDKFLFPDYNSLTIKVPIEIFPIATGQYNPKDLITINPYKVTELNEAYFMKNGEIDNMVLSKFTPNSKFENFSVNLNKRNQNGDYVLIPNEKLPLIIRHGLKLNFDLMIKQDNLVLETKNIDVFYLYNNDFLEINVTFNNTTTGPQELKLLLKFKNNQVLIENNGNNEWNFDKNLELIINNVFASLPSDQNTKVAKWTQIIDKETSPVNEHFQTEEPFIFEMNFLPNNDSTAARYVPFIDGVPIGQSGSNKIFKADLGPYVIAQKEAKAINVLIEIKEFDPVTDSYSKVVYTLRVSVKLNNDPLLFELKGWDSPTLSPEDKKKFFNPEDKEKYRGDYVDEKTGMYIPKVVWVNATPPKTFMYDPLDKNGQKLEGLDQTNSSNVKYDIGYLAQINAPGFKDGDFQSMPTIGGYKIEYPLDYIPDGEYPYSEIYSFDGINTFPKIIHESLTNNGMIFADKDLRQTILKKNESDLFIYQFALISPNSIPNNLFSLYDKFTTNKNEKVFVDFWDTYHGTNLFNYLKEINLVPTMEQARALEFADVNTYWNSYVNFVTLKPPSDGKIDLSTVNFSKIFLNLENIDQLAIEVKRRIDEEINAKISKPSNVSLKIEEDYLIEVDNNKFLEKIKTLFNNYNLADPSKGNVSFEIIATASSKYIKNTAKINVLNSKFIPFDLSIIKGQDVLFNSEDLTNRPSNKFEWIKNDLIKTLVHQELKGETGKNDLILNKDYVLDFYTNVTNTNGQISKKYFTGIDDAINNCLLLNVNYKEFSNDLFVEVKASNSSDSYKLKNSYTKRYNNSNKNKNPIVSSRNYDLNLVKKQPILKFNTASNNFPSSGDKKEFLLSYIKEYNENIIFKLINRLNSSETRTALINKDFKITSEDGTKTLEEIIEEFMKIADPANFDITIKIKIEAIPTSELLENSFILTLNNSSKNDALPNIEDENEENNKLPSIEDENNFKPPIAPNDFWAQNNWWIITLISLSAFSIISFVLYKKIKKNRNIR